MVFKKRFAAIVAISVLALKAADIQTVNPEESKISELSRIDLWQPGNYKKVTVQENFFSGETVYERGKITPFLYSPPFTIQLSDPVVLSFKLKTTQSSNARLFFRPAGGKFNDSDRVDFNVVEGIEFKSYKIYLPVQDKVIEQLRLDIFALEARVEFKDFKLQAAAESDELPLPIVSKHTFNERVPDISPLQEEENLFSFGPKPQQKNFTLHPESSTAVKSRRYALNFQAPTHHYILEFQSATSASGVLNFQIQAYDIFDKKLDPVDFKLDLEKKEEKNASLLFELPSRTASFSVEMISEDLKGKLNVNEITIYPFIRPADVWQAEWIWHGNSAHPHQAFFRKTFRLAEIPVQAKLLIAMDDDITEIYINNTKLPLPANANSVRLPDEIDVTSHLRQGENLLAIAGTDRGGWKGLLCELAVYNRDKYELIKSDSSWRVAGTAPPEWPNLDFDDAAWSEAVITSSIDVPHPYMGPKAILKSFKILKAALTGRQIDISLEIEPATSDISFTFNLRNGKHSYFIGNSREKDLQPGELNRVDFSSNLSDVIPAGKYVLEIQSADAVIPPSRAVELEVGLESTQKDLPRVKVHYGKNLRTPQVEVDGEIHSFTHLFTPDTHFDQIENLNKNRVKQYWLSGNQPLWNGPGDYDFTPVDRKIAELLQFSPQSFVIIQIPVDTFLLRSMKKWVEMYPEEVVLDAEGNHLIEVHGLKMAVPSWGSEVWLNEIKTLVSELVKHVRKQPYASQIIGFMPIAGLGAEWMYYGAHNHLYVDYSKPFLKKFHSWLQEKYTTIENLNNLWKSSYSDFAEVVLPSPEERDFDDNFTFIDPGTRRRLIDYRTFFSELTAGIIDQLGNVVKTASDGRSLYGTYYGYITYTAVNNWSENGHFELRKLLDSNNIDFLVSLVRYDNRYVGGESGSMTPVNSYALHGKAAVIQSDLRTHRTVAKTYSPTANLFESAAVLKRELAWALVTGAVFEFGYFGRGWIASDSRLMELVGRYQQLEKEYADAPEVFKPGNNQLAVIVDDYSVNYVLQKSPYSRMGIRELIRQLAHVGTGFDLYLLSDLPRIADDYRCFVFANTYLFDSKQLDYVKQHLQNKGRTLVWLHAPAITDGSRWMPERVSDITGIEMKILQEAVEPASKVVMNSKYLRPGDSAYSKRTKDTLGPRFIPQQGTVLACDDDNSPTVVQKKFADWTSIYSWTPNLSASVLQHIAEQAGLTIINPDLADSTYASGKMIAVHTNHGGVRRFNIPDENAEKLIELFSGMEYNIQSGICEITLNPKSTYLFTFE